VAIPITNATSRAAGGGKPRRRRDPGRRWLVKAASKVIQGSIDGPTTKSLAMMDGREWWLNPKGGLEVATTGTVPGRWKALVLRCSRARHPCGETDARPRVHSLSRGCA
jgi:hypothetical protein